MVGSFKLFSKLLTSNKFLVSLALITVFIGGWQIYKNRVLKIKIHIGNPIQSTSFGHKEFTYIPTQPMQTQMSFDVDSLPKWDYTHLINITGFNFLIENTVCKENETVDILLAIHSAPRYVDRRNAIRKTWGQPRKGLKTLFFIGAVDNQTLQDNIDNEDNKYHDIIQGNFVDAYKNMTYKHIMIFKYAIYYCPKVKYILKGDDDIFVNIDPILNYVKNNITDKNFILCNARGGERTIRFPSKWLIPFSEYPPNIYPDYCQGFAIFYTHDVIFKIYKEAQRGQFFWLDDVFVSGILAHRIKAKHIPLPRDTRLAWIQVDNIIKGNKTGFNKDFWYGPIEVKPEQMYKLWDALNKQQIIHV